MFITSFSVNEHSEGTSEESARFYGLISNNSQKLCTKKN